MKKSLFLTISTVSLILSACSSENLNALNTENINDQISASSKKDDDADRFFVENSVAKPKTHKFLTNSQFADEHPIWSPDGKTIAFQRSTGEGTGYNIWLMKPDGSQQRQLTKCDLDCQQASWTPDGKNIAYRKATGKTNPNGSREFDIAMINIASGQEKPLIVYPGDDKHPNFSHDGKNLVFNSERDGNKANIYVVPASNTKATPVRVTKSTDTNDVHPNFSHDGKQILFHSYVLNAPKTADTEDVPSKLGIVNTTGENLRWLNVGNLLYPKHPFFTPEQNIITFHATDPKTLKRNVYALNLNKPGDIVQITDIKNAKHPEISPDGKYLAYAHKRTLQENADKEYDIAVVEIELKELKKAF